MKGRIDLHRELERGAFDHAVLCTCTFDPEFFEGYCLDHFDSLSGNNNVTVILDHQEYSRIVSGPPSQWPRQANVRYLLHPARVVGRFHPKVFLVASRKRGLLIVGSANLTRPGLGRNAELVGVYRFEKEKHEDTLPLFRQAVDFLAGVASRWPGDDLRSNLNAMTDDATWLTAQGEEADYPLRLIHNLERPIWEQISEMVSAPADALFVVSRYFDGDPRILDRIASELKPKKILIYTENGTTTMTEQWLSHPLVRKGKVLVHFCTYEDDEHRQALHAKGLAIVRGGVTLAFGSANFTSAGLLSTASTGNVEVMIVAESVTRSKCDPERLFDPGKTARPEPLRSAKRDDAPPPPPPPPLTLHVARLVENRLACSVTVPDEMAAEPLVAILVTPDEATTRVKLSDTAEGERSAEVDSEMVRRVGEGATIVFIESARPDGRRVRSNRVLLINLLDIQTGRSARRERRLREAERSAGQFSAVLEELIRVGDMDALQSFLTFCDIQITTAGRRSFGPPRERWDEGRSELRALGVRNLRTYETLHEAAIAFVERHIRRLERHSERPTLLGVANSMHVALAVARVLDAQVERMLIGLESAPFSLSPEEWFLHRARLDKYLSLFRRLVDLLNETYVPRLLQRYDEEAIREAIAPDLEPLREVSLRFLQVKDRADLFRRNTLRVRIPSGELKVPFVHDDNVISDKRWPDYATAVRGTVERCDSWAGGAA